MKSGQKETEKGQYGAFKLFTVHVTGVRMIWMNKAKTVTENSLYAHEPAVNALRPVMVASLALLQKKVETEAETEKQPLGTSNGAWARTCMPLIFRGGDSMRCHENLLYLHGLA